MADDALDRVREGLHGGFHVIKRRIRPLSEFKEFISKGSALDLAVGVVIGAAFNGVVQSLVKDVLSPLVSWPGTADFNKMGACLKDVSPAPGNCAVTLAYGRFITSLISFVLTSAAVFFFVVRPMNKMRSWRKADTPPEVATKDCPECLSQIPAAATRCSYCTVVIPA